MPRQFLSEYFSFTRKERNGIIVIIILILLFSLLPFLYPLFIHQKQYDHSQFEKEIAILQLQQEDSSNRFEYKNSDGGNFRQYSEASQRNYQEKTKAELFEFDPNILPANGWKRLGLRDKTIATIQNYLNRGGKFYKPEDIGKIWGLHADEVQRLLPYIKITAVEKKYANGNSYQAAYEKKPFVKEIRLIEVNDADSTAFVDLPGIGAGFARRIINFRNKLGGFVSVDQIGETYGLPDSTFQKIKPRLAVSNPVVKQFNINAATINEMKQHPYIRYPLANAIVQYRLQHGNFSSVNEIKKIMMVTDELFIKAAPYLKIAE